MGIVEDLEFFMSCNNGASDDEKQLIVVEFLASTLKNISENNNSKDDVENFVKLVGMASTHILKVTENLRRNQFPACVPYTNVDLTLTSSVADVMSEYRRSRSSRSPRMSRAPSLSNIEQKVEELEELRELELEEEADLSRMLRSRSPSPVRRTSKDRSRRLSPIPLNRTMRRTLRDEDVLRTAERRVDDVLEEAKMSVSSPATRRSLNQLERSVDSKLDQERSRRWRSIN
jgi:hypothetical protein